MPKQLDRRYLVIAAIVTITAVLYFPVRQFEFQNFDDNAYVTDNQNVQDDFGADNLRWAFSFREKRNAYWHPLTWLSHMLDVQLFGLEPSWHHMHNLFLHLCNAVLLFLFLNQTTGSLWKSCVVAAIFAIHPLNVESVAWVAERKNVLSTFFLLLTLICYAKYVRSRNIIFYGATTGCFVLGLLSKPMLVTVPFLLLLLDYWPLQRIQIEASEPGKKTGIRGKDVTLLRLVGEKIPFFLIVGLTIYIVTGSLTNTDQFIPTTTTPFDLRIYNALVSYLKYIFKLIWPHNLAVFYPYPEAVALWKVIAAAIVLSLVTLFAIITMRTFPFILVGWLWYLGTLVPVSGIIKAGLWPALADRWAYVPCIGLLMALVWGFSYLLGNKITRYKPVALIVALIPVMGFSLKASHQIKTWENSLTLFQHAENITEKNFVAYSQLSVAYTKTGNVEKALHYHSNYYKALKSMPRTAVNHDRIGTLLLHTGNLSKAQEHFQAALRLNPNYEPARTNLKKIDLLQEYLEQFQAVDDLSSMPNEALLQYGLGVYYTNAKKYDLAVFHFRYGLKMQPQFTAALNGLALSLTKAAKYDRALDAFQELYTRSIDRATVAYNIACVYSLKGEVTQSLKWLERAVNEGYRNWDMIKTDSDLQNTRQSPEFGRFIRQIEKG